MSPPDHFPIDLFPDLIQRHIFRFLNFESRRSLRLVSREMGALCDRMLSCHYAGPQQLEINLTLADINVGASDEPAESAAESSIEDMIRRILLEDRTRPRCLSFRIGGDELAVTWETPNEWEEACSQGHYPHPIQDSLARLVERHGACVTSVVVRKAMSIVNNSEWRAHVLPCLFSLLARLPRLRHLSFTDAHFHPGHAYSLLPSLPQPLTVAIHTQTFMNPLTFGGDMVWLRKLERIECLSFYCDSAMDENLIDVASTLGALSLRFPIVRVYSRIFMTRAVVAFASVCDRLDLFLNVDLWLEQDWIASIHAPVRIDTRARLDRLFTPYITALDNIGVVELYDVDVNEHDLDDWIDALRGVRCERLVLSVIDMEERPVDRSYFQALLAATGAVEKKKVE